MKTANFEQQLERFFQNQTIGEVIEVLDEMLLVLVLYVELKGEIYPDNLAHHYLTVCELRDLLAQYDKEQQRDSLHKFSKKTP